MNDKVIHPESSTKLGSSSVVALLRRFPRLIEKEKDELAISVKKKYFYSIRG